MLGIKRFGWALGYALMVAFGGCGLWFTLGSDGEWAVELLGAMLLVLIGVAGLATVTFVPWYGRRRPGPVLAIAPSGAPATFFRRSPFMVGCCLVFSLGLAGWTGALAVVLHQRDHDTAALAIAGLAVPLLWPAAAAAQGKVSPGGLWLTPFGVEHRQEAVSWAVSWADLTGARSVTTRCVLPFAPGHGPVAIQPVVLALRAGGNPAKQRSVRWVWAREIRGTGTEDLVVDTYDLAGGSALIAESIRHYLAYPRLRAHLGTEHSLPRRSCSCRVEAGHELQYTV